MLLTEVGQFAGRRLLQAGDTFSAEGIPYYLLWVNAGCATADEGSETPECAGYKTSAGSSVEFPAAPVAGEDYVYFKDSAGMNVLRCTPTPEAACSRLLADSTTASGEKGHFSKVIAGSCI
jgi:hypothetical protein